MDKQRHYTLLGSGDVRFKHGWTEMSSNSTRLWEMIEGVEEGERDERAHLSRESLSLSDGWSSSHCE